METSKPKIKTWREPSNQESVTEKDQVFCGCLKIDPSKIMFQIQRPPQPYSPNALTLDGIQNGPFISRQTCIAVF